MKTPPITLAALLAAMTLFSTVPRASAQTNWGNALSLDGLDDHAQVAATPALGLTNQVTFEAWVHPHTAKCNTILSRGDGGNEYTDFIFQVGYDGAGHCTSRLLSFWGAGAWDTSTATVPLNEWTHVAVTFDGAVKKFYLNGVLDRTVNRPGQFYQSNQPTLYLGRQGTTCNCNFFDGELDDVRIWNVIRSAGEIQAGFTRTLTGAEPGLVAYWQFDESGTTIYDSTPYGHDGTLVSDPWYTNSTVPVCAAVATLPATDIDSEAATLHGSVNPGGQETGAWFEWGTSPGYGNTNGFQLVGSGVTNVSLNTILTGLTSGATVHYRVVATNQGGIAYGEDHGFTTPAYFDAVDTGLPPLSYSAAAWGDYDNDGDLDVVLNGKWPETTVYISTLYGNRGDGTFEVAYNYDDSFEPGSVAWGDCDNDGKLDLAFAGSELCRIYRNQGNGSFTNLQVQVPSDSSSVSWGDCNNDGRLDFLTTGWQDGGTNLTRIYLNHPDGTFAWQTNALLPAVDTRHGAPWAPWGDYDGDGHLDLALSGNSETGRLTRLCRNLGNGTFSSLDAGLPRTSGGSIAWGDCDNDGNLDLVLTGATDTGSISRVYRNLGDGTFSNWNAGLLPLSISAAAWGDWDNDGDLDLAISGWDTATVSPAARIYRNQGEGTFVPLNIDLTGVVEGTASWADYDQDGDLDLLLSGLSFTEAGEVTLLYRNNCSISNTPPSAPGGLSAQITGNGVRLAWTAAADAQTPVSNLTYNIRIGTVSDGCDIVSPQADPATGRRLLPAMGNANYRRFSIVTNLPSGLYFWSVQAVDSAFAGGMFAAEQVFLVDDRPSLSIGTVTNSIVVSWPMPAGTWLLHTRTNLVTGSGWTEIPPPYATNTTHHLHIEPTTENARFYRLQQP